MSTARSHRRRRLLAAAGAILTCSVAYGEVYTDRPSALVNFPYIVVDDLTHRDTVVQLTNTGDTTVNARCFYIGTGEACTESCESQDETPCSCGASTFTVALTPLQPIGWRASDTVVQQPPFIGSLRCVVVDAMGVPTDQNVLFGTATLEHYVADTGEIDIASYNAAGNLALAGAVNGDDYLVLGGGAAEYTACPVESTANVFFDFAVEPAALSTIATRLVLMRCSHGMGNSAAPLIVHYRVSNEFEQFFTVDLGLSCLQDRRICLIDNRCEFSFFNANVVGTPTGQIRMTSSAPGDVPEGFVSLVVEEHSLAGALGHVQSTAHHAYGIADATAVEYSYIGAPTAPGQLACPAAPSPTPTGTPTSTPTATPTTTPTATPTSTPTATPTTTPTATPTSTGVPPGGACADSAQCTTGFCADGVCCDTACTAPLEQCNLPGRLGTCASTAAPAPTLAAPALAVAALLLGGIAALALRRSVR